MKIDFSKKTWLTIIIKYYYKGYFYREIQPYIQAQDKS